MKNSDLPVRMQILNISVNLARLSNWVADSYEQKDDLIARFLDQTKEYLREAPEDSFSPEFQPTWQQFKRAFRELEKQPTQQNKLLWAEKALTWANILQHRAKLA